MHPFFILLSEHPPALRMTLRETKNRLPNRGGGEMEELCFVQLLEAEGFEIRDVMGGNVPNDVQANFTVIVNDDVPHTLDCRPVHLIFCFAAQFVGQLAYELSDLKNAERNRILRLSFSKETLGRLIDREQGVFNVFAVIHDVLHALHVTRLHR